jgi:hypothetical protein
VIYSIGFGRERMAASACGTEGSMSRLPGVALIVVVAIASRLAVAQMAPGEIGGAGGRLVAPPYHPPIGSIPGLAPGIGLTAPGLGPSLGLAPAWGGAAGGAEPSRPAPTQKAAVAALRAALEDAREQDIESLPIVQKFQHAISR